MPHSPASHSPAALEVKIELAAIKKDIETLETTLRAEFNAKHRANQKDIKDNFNRMRSIDKQLATLSKSITRLELKIARYAGGAGVLTAIAIKLLDKYIH